VIGRKFWDAYWWNWSEDSQSRLKAAVGSPGGSRIITTVLQVILNLVDHGMNIEAAVAHPRIHHQWLPDNVWVEKLGDWEDRRNALMGTGHQAVGVEPFGNATGIEIEWKNGVARGTADPRGIGAAR